MPNTQNQEYQTEVTFVSQQEAETFVDETARTKKRLGWTITDSRVVAVPYGRDDEFIVYCGILKAIRPFTRPLQKKSK